MPGRYFNVLFALEPPTSLEQVREGVDRLFVRSKTPFQIMATHEAVDHVKPLMEYLGFVARQEIPGMVLDPLPDAYPDPPKNLDVRTVWGPEEARDYVRTAAGGFGTPMDYFDVWVDGLVARSADATLPGAAYLGIVEGRPVATSLRITTGRVAGVYFVSTLPELRRRGFGEAMTWRAAVDGRREGCTLSYLQASVMGRPVYEKMGYRLVEWYQEWSAPAQPSG